MKKIFKKMLFAMMMSSTIVLTGCGFSMDENYVITNITKEELPNGDVLLTIIYEDEEMEPTTVVIPKGAPGEDGNDGVGIEKIEPTQSGDGLYTILTITYTNNETKTVRVPNGISIVGISTPTLDENGNMVFSFIYSNGEQSDPISIPKGEKGQDGIDGREVEFNVTDTHIQWRYVSDDPENQNEWQDLVALSELTGTGIKSVDIKESDNKGNNKFFVEVIYTNGDVVNIPLATNVSSAKIMLKALDKLELPSQKK